jgi:hypothetical protein
MHKSATKCNKTIGKWCKNKHEASKIIDTFVTYQVDPEYHIYHADEQISLLIMLLYLPSLSTLLENPRDTFLVTQLRDDGWCN